MKAKLQTLWSLLYFSKLKKLTHLQVMSDSKIIIKWVVTTVQTLKKQSFGGLIIT